MADLWLHVLKHGGRSYYNTSFLKQTQNLRATQLEPFSTSLDLTQKRIFSAGSSYIEAARSKYFRPASSSRQAPMKVRVGMGPYGVQSIESEWGVSNSQVSSWYEFLGEDTGKGTLELVGLSRVRLLNLFRCI
jgi:hypothetical protein